VELPPSLDLAVAAADGESSRGSRVSRRRRLEVLIGAALGFGLANCTRTAWILGVRAADAWRGSEGVPGKGSSAERTRVVNAAHGDAGGRGAAAGLLCRDMGVERGR
jgi:hypothetical protein